MEDIWLAISPVFETDYGMSDKFFGHGWAPPTEFAPVSPDDVYVAMNRAGFGETLMREEFPEASYVWNEVDFEKNVKDFFWVSGFMAAKGELADVLKTVDHGKGGLLPYPIYQADKVTPYPVNAYLLNFGGPQALFLRDQTPSESLRNVLKPSAERVGLWRYLREDDPVDFDIAIREPDVGCPDIWKDPQMGMDCFFLKDSVMMKIREQGVQSRLKFVRCRVVRPN